MATTSALSPARAILECVRSATNADIPSLRHLVVHQHDVLKLNLVLRIILTFLPESTNPNSYTSFLHDLLAETLNDPADPDLLSVEYHDIPEAEARRKVRTLRLLPLADSRYPVDESDDDFTLFLFHRARRIDGETGSLPLLPLLLEPFLDHNEHLRIWLISTLLPLLRLSYEYYPHNGSTCSLEAFEELGGSSAVNLLLSKVAQRDSIGENLELGRDLRGLVGPWMLGESLRENQKLGKIQRRESTAVESLKQGIKAIEENDNSTSGWAFVNEWLLELALRDFPRVSKVVEQWDGPRDVDYGDWNSGAKGTDEEAIQASVIRYAQAGLAAIYTTNDKSTEAIKSAHRILLRIAQIMEFTSPADLRVAGLTFALDASTLNYLQSLSHAYLLHNTLLQVHNPLTVADQASMALCQTLISSVYTLQQLGHPMTCRKAAELSLFSTKFDQKTELQKTMHNTQTLKIRDEKSWSSIREQILWLRDWNFNLDDQIGEDIEEPRGVFCKVERVETEAEILRAFLIGTHYELANDIYCKQSSHPIPLDVVERIVLAQAMSSFDSASNGNRTRGGVRKASDIINSFRDHFPESESFNQATALIWATHAMSFYSLTLQHGVPFKPVNIRTQEQPLYLVEKILDQNPRSYTKLDDLITIGRNLIAADLTGKAQSLESFLRQEYLMQTTLKAEQLIIAMAIKAALAEDDFDTAYSYVVNRFTPADITASKLSESPGASTIVQGEGDLAWQVAYKAGTYLSSNLSGPSVLRRLEQRMELLSQALLLAPSSQLSEVLIAWRECEEKMNVLLAQESEKETEWDDKGDRSVPGGFGETSSPTVQKSREPARGSLNEEAPMGLFDVARGAAAALSKSAFPLRSPGTTTSVTVPAAKVEHLRDLSQYDRSGSDQGSMRVLETDGRVRKRDMVSNMVTGGLASGIGWVLGAPPVRQE